MSTKRLYVGNLPWTTKEQDLQEAFAQWGATSATIPLREDGRSKGFGFVDVAEDQAADAIKAMHESDMGGRQLTVNEARPREDRREDRSQAM